MCIRDSIVSAQQALGNNSLKALFEGIFMYITAGFIWYVIFWLSKHVSDRKQLEEQSVIAMSSSWGIFFLVFFSVIREGFETVVFLLASFSMTQTFSYLGFFTGIIAALILVYIFVIQGKRFNIRSFFQATTLLLVFLASGMPEAKNTNNCLLYTSPSPRDATLSRMPSSA